MRRAFLPMPVNDVQLRVLRQVDTHAQTLVQGPPGTGKTPAAVLISHLLAQGKRVWLRAPRETGRAGDTRQAPRGDPATAVSVVGAFREDMAELQVAVERLAAGKHDDDDDVSRRIGAQLDAIDTCCAVVARTLVTRLLEAREREVRIRDVSGSSGTLARRRDAQQAPSWLEQRLGPFNGESPLTGDAVMASRGERWTGALLGRRAGRRSLVSWSLRRSRSLAFWRTSPM